MRRRWVVLGLATAWAAWPAAAPATKADGWTIQPTPDVPGAQRSALLGVSCTQPKACTAVGFAEAASGPARPLAMRWDGKRWSLQPVALPAGALSGILHDVACTRKRSCVAVGDYQTTPGVFVALAERWDGSAWAVEPAPDVPGTFLDTLNGVACPALDECIAVGQQVAGNDSRTLAMRRQGGAWTVVPTAERAGTTFSTLADVACARRDDCAAVGLAYVSIGGGTVAPRPLAERWNGASWKVESTQDPAALRQTSVTGVSCPQPGACVAVGFYEASLNTFATLAEHQAGASWTLRPAPSPPGRTLGAVSCPTARSCIAVGGGSAPLAAQWDGMAWSERPTPMPAAGTEAGLSDVDCPKRRVCVAVGSVGITPDTGGTLAMSLGV